MALWTRGRSRPAVTAPTLALGAAVAVGVDASDSILKVSATLFRYETTFETHDQRKEVSSALLPDAS